MSDRVKAETIGELDIHLGNLQARVTELAGNMATSADFKRLEDRLASFATKAELKAMDDKLSQSVADWNRSKPSYVFNNVVRFAVGIAAMVGFGGLIVQAVLWVNRMATP